jgi:hypothetical protein
MSTLVTDRITHPGKNASILRSTGNIVQCVRVRSDVITTWASNNSGNGTTITNLNLTITPKSASNFLIMRWNLYGEMNHNNVLLVHRDGSLITDVGYEGYNNTSGNVRWSGITNSIYDQNDSSTATTLTIIYGIPTGSTTARTYAPAVRSSGAANLTYYQNRTFSSTGGDNNENGVCFGIIYEVTR